MAVAARRRAIALTMLGFVLLPPDRWFGVDKLKHFLVSALVHSASYTASRAVGMNRSNANVAAGVSTGTIGILREIHDKRVGRVFSVKDLVWDAAGGASALALMNGTR